MKSLYTTLLLLLCLSAHSATLADRLVELQAVTLTAGITQPVTGVNDFPGLETAQITYYEATGDTVKPNTVLLYIWNGAAYWNNRQPSVLAAAPVAEEYMTDRNTAFSASQIENFVNSVWEDANANTDDVLEFSVTAVDGQTVRVSGKFHVGAAREERAYYIRLADPNGSVTVGNANIQFQRITE